jgi:predicted O-methyltransferase YrrM
VSLDDYILSHIDEEGEYLHNLWRATQLKLSYGQMASGHLQGRLLKMLVEMIRPKRILELGTFSGYSALSMAEGLQEDGELHTIEVFDENEDFLRQWISNSPWAERVHLHIGDALDIVPMLGDNWDLAFIDADKRDYVKYYEMLLPRMNIGGFILADNTLWYGRITEEARPSDLQTLGLQSFNDMVAKDNRVEKIILPLRDGLTIIRKR